MSKITLECLAWLLDRAVPNMKVESAVLVRSSAGLCWIRVDPRHYEYWKRFRKTFPSCVQIARSYKATGGSLMNEGFCPEFDDLENLLNWLFEVLELTQGERNLLFLLCKRCKKCHKF